MLHQPYVLAGDLNISLSQELLAKVRNPEYTQSGGATAAGIYTGAMDEGDDEGGVVARAPARIESRVSSKGQKKKSNSE